MNENKPIAIEQKSVIYIVKPPQGSGLNRAERKLFKLLTEHRYDWTYDQLMTLVKVVRLESLIAADKKQVENEGRTQRNGSGTLVLHPLVRDIRENEKLIASMKRYVGFGTSKIQTTLDDDDDEPEF